MALSGEQINQFINDGYVRLEGVVSDETLKAGQEVIWRDLGYDSNNPDTWAEPVVHLVPTDDTPFKEAFDSPELAEALDQLVGGGRWIPRPNLGNFVVRFPHDDESNDTGWHIDSSFPGEDAADYKNWRVNAQSRGRALLMLFLFSDVGEEDGPTQVRVGSHKDVSEALQPFGDEGVAAPEAGELVTEVSKHRPVVTATGKAGDVYLLHPFLAHAAQKVRGSNARLMAQPGLVSKEPFRVGGKNEILTPVEIATQV